MAHLVNRDKISKFRLFHIYIQTLLRLGIFNLIRVFAYRLSLYFGLFKIVNKPSALKTGAYFDSLNVSSISCSFESWSRDAAEEFRRLKEGRYKYFSFHEMEVGNPPNWFNDPFFNSSLGSPTNHWSDYNPNSCNTDIKIFWDISRFSWMPRIARYYRYSKDNAAVTQLESWVQNWNESNPYNLGPNWLCGQETSIRLLNFLIGLHLLEIDRIPNSLSIQFAEEHLKRIFTTLSYAIAQDNNHATSEAAALLVGGAWLRSLSENSSAKIQNANKWYNVGRKTIEERILKLVEEDGSFSQRSTNYHRMLLDTLCIVGFWQKKLGLNEFSDEFQSKVKALIIWLYQFVDKDTGYAPNFGANDGSQILNLTRCSYRDYRPCLQLASAIFLDEKLFPKGDWDEQLEWFQVKNLSESSLIQGDTYFQNGGYIIIRPNSSFAFLHAPNFKFRPSQSDILHLDLWYRGVNILQDSGTYSYNIALEEVEKFSGTTAHNTISFGSNNQMPKISKFLYGDWRDCVSSTEFDDQRNLIHISRVINSFGNSHERRVRYTNFEWQIEDIFSGCESGVDMWWHLASIEWELKEHRCISKLADMEITGDIIKNLIRLDSGYISYYYLDRHSIPILRVPLSPNGGRVLTRISLKSS